MAQIYTNEPLVESRSKIGRYASLGGIAIIFGGLIVSLQANNPKADNTNTFLLAYAALISGFVLSNVGAYFMSRWGMGAYKKLNEAIKGLDKRYSLYNYYLPVPNVLLTPYSVVVLLIKNQDGKIVGTKKGWKQGSSFMRIIRAFSSEGIGDPPAELERQKTRLRAFIEEQLGAAKTVPVEGFILFTNPQAEVELEDVEAPVIVLKAQPDALKNALRRDKRTPVLTDNIYTALLKLFAETAEEKYAQEQKGWWRFWQR